jgi:hypothetical protein
VNVGADFAYLQVFEVIAVQGFSIVAGVPKHQHIILELERLDADFERLPIEREAPKIQVGTVCGGDPHDVLDTPLREDREGAVGNAGHAGVDELQM